MTAETTTAHSSGNTKPSLVMRARSFQLTLNEPEYLEQLLNEFRCLKSCDYLAWCKETAPTTGHEHAHIYAHFENSYKISKRILRYGAHIEICKGSPQQNIAYIEKNGDFHEEGKRPCQGYHTVRDLKEISNPDELNWNEYNTWMKIQKRPKKVKKSEWLKDIKIYWIQGPSGCGKSNMAQEMADDEFEEVKHVNNFWIGVVDGTGCAIYDDFRDSHMSASEFINFVDYRSHNLNTKGGEIRNNYTKIIITTVQRIDDVYRNLPDEPRQQWLRRCEVINMFGDKNKNDILEEE